MNSQGHQTDRSNASTQQTTAEKNNRAASTSVQGSESRSVDYRGKMGTRAGSNTRGDIAGQYGEVSRGNKAKDK